MTRRGPSFDLTRVDALVILATLAAATWVATRSATDIEKTLNLRPFPKFSWVAPRSDPAKVKTLREKYAEAYPMSPLSWINRNSWVEAFERGTARIQAASLAILLVISPGIGLIAVRNCRGPRARVGPGRIAGAIAFVGSTAGLANEYLLRRSHLTNHATVHFDLGNAWIVVFLGVSVAILSAWLLLAFSGRWRRGRGWREWLGRCLGAAWVAALLWQILLEPLAQVYSWRRAARVMESSACYRRNPASGRTYAWATRP